MDIIVEDERDLYIIKYFIVYVYNDLYDCVF